MGPQMGRPFRLGSEDIRLDLAGWNDGGLDGRLEEGLSARFNEGIEGGLDR